jgi:hypothetical protein
LGRISGHNAAVVAPAAASAHFFGVRFRPGEAFAFVSVSAVERKDKMIPLAYVLVRSAKPCWTSLRP